MIINVTIVSVFIYCLGIFLKSYFACLMKYTACVFGFFGIEPLYLFYMLGSIIAYFFKLLGSILSDCFRF